MGFLDSLFGGRPPQSPQQLGYNQSPELSFLSDYITDRSMSKKEAKGFASTLLDSVSKGNLDQDFALSMLESRTQPNSGFYKTKQFENLLNYQLPEDKAKGIVGDVYSSNLFRAPNASELDEMYGRAYAAGVVNNPNELRNFVTSTLARSPEGEAKRPFDDYQMRMASIYGSPVRDSEGRNTGQYRVFGYDDDKYEAARDTQKRTKDFTDTYLSKMGAKGALT